MSTATNTYDDWLNKVRDILETSNSNALDFIDSFQSTLFSEEIFVYTNKGDMRTLPKGATALDFAFEIHSTLGATCQSIKVNGKLVPLAHPLSQGDKVVVISNSNQKPSEQWLKWVITSKARNKIRQSLRDEKRKAGEMGKEQRDIYDAYRNDYRDKILGVVEEQGVQKSQFH